MARLAAGTENLAAYAAGVPGWPVRIVPMHNPPVMADC